MRKQAILYVNIAVLLFGLSGLFAKWIDMPAICITFGRVLFSSLTLGGYLLLTGQSLKIADRRDRVLLLCTGAVLAFHWWSFLESIQLSTVAIGTLTFSAFPLFVTFLEPMVFHKKLERRNILTAVLIFIGVIITVPEFSMENSMSAGIAVGMISSFAYAILTLLNKHFAASYSGTLTAFYEQTTAAIVLLPFILRIGFHPAVKELGLVIFLGIVTTAFAQTLFISSLKMLPAQLAGICSSMETVYGILFALLLLGEVPTIREIAGALIIVGVVIFAQMRKE